MGDDPLQGLLDRMVVLRGRRVVLSTELAPLYGVEPRALAEAVERNLERFPDDFMFAVTHEEWARVRWQLPADAEVPLAFTEAGIAMLSGVLESERAIEVSVAIIRWMGRS